jgi:sulfite oxidase
MKDRKHADVEGILWGEAAIANVKWGGVRLNDLLHRAGVAKTETREDLHVCFASHAAVCEEEDWFGSSVPLSKALSDEGDALVAYEVRVSLEVLVLNIIEQVS